MNNENNIENVININNLTNEEIEQAKQNGFIVVGKAGTGKTTLINMLFNKVVGKVEKSYISVTQISIVYYYKLKNGKLVCLIDTPGLADTNKIENKNIDNLHLEGISDIISKEKIHIKGILFLVNFQVERFDSDEQNALLEYNRIFPLKDFWKSLVIIYTHFYSDEDEDEKTEEEIIEERSASNKEIFSKLMEKVKNVSEVISYENLKKKYFNSHSDPKNNKKKIKRNNQNREELEVLLDELCKNEPLFTRVEVTTVKNHKWICEEDGKEYIGEVKKVSYFDFNNEPLKETIHIISKKEVEKNFNYPRPSSHCDQFTGGYDNGGNIIYIPKPKPIEPDAIPIPNKLKENNYSYVAKSALGGAGVGGIVGCAVAAVASGPVGWIVGGCSLAGAVGAALFGWGSREK